jgi:hypothetical protein
MSGKKKNLNYDCDTCDKINHVKLKQKGLA